MKHPADPLVILLMSLSFPLKILVIASVIFFSLGDVSRADRHLIPAGVYLNDPSHTSVHFKISHLGFSRFVGRFNASQATLSIDPENLAKTTLSAAIPIDSLDANSQHLKDSVLGKEVFYVDRYPEASFKSNFFHPLEDNKGILFGVLSLRGVSHPIQFDVELVGHGPHPFSKRYILGFQGETVIKRSTWGLFGFPAVSRR